MELLELAARAIGFYLHVNHVEATQLYKDGEYVCFWNPLTDDGDALRLAKKLFLSSDVGFGGCQIVVFRRSYGIGPEVDVVVNGDLPGATLSDEAYRRAFVRAAAEIGRAMP